MLNDLMPFALILMASAVAYYHTPARWRGKWFAMPLKLLRGVWLLVLEIVCVRVENGATKYKPSTRKWLSYLGPLGFTLAVVVKLLYPLWAITRMELLKWGQIADSVDTPLILGLLAKTLGSGYAYFKGKQQEIGQHEVAEEPQK